METSLTKEQKDAIEKAFMKAWDDDIYENILTDENKNEKGNVHCHILFQMEEILKRMAAGFGLGAMSAMEK